MLFISIEKIANLYKTAIGVGGKHPYLLLSSFERVFYDYHVVFVNSLSLCPL